MRVGVIGAGIAGSLVAESLTGLPGVELASFERSHPDEHALSDTGLVLGPGALKALRLHLPARHEALRAVSLPWERWQSARADGTGAQAITLRNVAEETGIRLRGAELYRQLRRPLRHGVRYGHTLEALEEDAGGRLVPVFARSDGALVRDGGFDLLVAADGRYSRLRSLSAGVPRTETLDLCVWRMLVPADRHCPLDDYAEWFNGPGRLVGFRMPGRHLAYVSGSFPLPNRRGDALPPECRDPAQQRVLFSSGRTRPCAPVAWMLDALQQHAGEVYWVRPQLTPALHATAGDRVLLLGDAEQMLVPTLGQGPTQAVEGGVLAGALLAAHAAPREAVAAFAALRAPRVSFVRHFMDKATSPLLPGSVNGGPEQRVTPEFGAMLRRLHTEIPELPGPAALVPRRDRAEA